MTEIKYPFNKLLVVELTDVVNKPEEIICGASLLPWWIVLLWGILALIIGIMFLATPGLTTVLFITLIGAYWLVGGLFTIGSLFVDKSNMGWKIFLAIINILAGIVILLYPLYSTIFLLAFFIIFVGFWGCFIGAAHLYQAFKSKDAGNGVLGVLSIVFGIILLVFPLVTAEILPFVAGGFMVVMGIIAIITSFTVKKAQALPGA